MNGKLIVLRNILLGLISALLIGCVPEVKEDVKEELPALKVGPREAPSRSITNFSKALRCMDALLIDYGVYDISMLVEDLKDNTGNVKAGARDMLISAISDITRRSHALKLIAFGADSGNLVSFLASANETGAYAVLPQFDIRGSISQLDKSVAAKDASAAYTYHKCTYFSIHLLPYFSGSSQIMDLRILWIFKLLRDIYPWVILRHFFRKIHASLNTFFCRSKG